METLYCYMRIIFSLKTTKTASALPLKNTKPGNGKPPFLVIARRLARPTFHPPNI
jgi:hypothetical protein